MRILYKRTLCSIAGLRRDQNGHGGPEIEGSACTASRRGDVSRMGAAPLGVVGRQGWHSQEKKNMNQNLASQDLATQIDLGLMYDPHKFTYYAPNRAPFRP